MNINIHYTMLEPVSHIGETSSTGSYFNTVLTSVGRIPIITGNSVRGLLRDFLAADLLETIGEKVSKEVFNVLFSGGNINGTLKNDVARARAIRDAFPMLSLLGGGVGTMILAGKMLCGNLYPVCRESVDVTDIESDISWRQLVDEIEFTRTDDGKNDQLAKKYMADPDEEKAAKASTQMRFSVQYMAKGTEFAQRIVLHDNCTDEEKGAFYKAFFGWFGRPYIGGMSSKGFGRFVATVGKNDISVDSEGSISKSDKVKDLIAAYDLTLLPAAGNLNLLETGGKSGKGKVKTADD